MSTTGGLRILAVADIWHGSNADAYVRAFRRLGHAVRVVPVDGFMATEWRRRPLRALRRCIEPVLVNQYNEALVAASEEHQTDLFFVYKGRHVQAASIRAIRAAGTVAVNVYPDVSLLAHGRHIPRALPVYDWVFHTKTYGVADLERLLGVRHASVLPHAYDPDVHRPVVLDQRDQATYGCDVSFIGTWSPKKQRVLEHVCSALSSVTLRVWGGLWEAAGDSVLGSRIQGRAVYGSEYTKALVASRINLAILSEARLGASSGDQITSRTFHIPATGAFMLHEQTSELLEYFQDDRDCATFSTTDELVRQIKRFLTNDAERQAIASAGRRRCLDCGYSVDCRAATLLEQVARLRKARVA